MDKTLLRQVMLTRRSALLPADRHRLDAVAQRTLIELPAFRQARTILLYQAFRGEVDTAAIAAAALAAGKRLALPRVIKEPRGLVLHAYSGDPATLRRGAYGIAEPYPEWPVIPLAAVDLAVVPGVAFDPAGNRLGYGGGYYDRLLPDLRQANPQAVLIGLGYRFQLLPALPLDPHDIQLDGVATD
ncbi:MAG TPA: 5-formyltetrahydrofolate cyclo-ligase [Symbiobacteriaceae bacterium]|jgi:5-formyltetrahydrofolate cyclo-ligase|nr:5-formyltetrahydrofolate cyclo-ligase [Symbiobacteriaceae bacterium]